jgi:hypothetical protein
MPAFDDDRYLLARAFAFLGGMAAAVSTLIAWYDFEIVLDNGRITHLFEVPVNLWNENALAAALLLGASLVAMALLVVPPAVGVRWPSIVASLIGVGILAYALIKCFDAPSLGIRSPNHPAIQARTYIDGGPLLAIIGGVMIALGGLVVLVGVHRTAVREATGRSPRATAPPPAGATPA